MTREQIGLPHSGNVTFARVIAVDGAQMLDMHNCPENGADRLVFRMHGCNNGEGGETRRPRREALLRI